MEGRLIEAARSRVVAALAARFRNLDLAEDAFAEAAASAVAAWRLDFPDDPAGWLWRSAYRKALDALARAETRRKAIHDAPPPQPTPEDILLDADQPIPDERLRLIFVCCHPALAPDARIALTLKVVCGLSVDRRARAFLVGRPTMLQRITRAKAKIASAGAIFEIPGPEAWPERVGAVLATLEVAYAQAHADAALAGGLADAPHDIVDVGRLHLRCLRQQGREDLGAHVVGPQIDQRPLVGAADRAAGGGDDDGFGHGSGSPRVSDPVTDRGLLTHRSSDRPSGYSQVTDGRRTRFRERDAHLQRVSLTDRCRS
jgi:predicted RNA polymerase sigma factor